MVRGSLFRGALGGGVGDSRISGNKFRSFDSGSRPTGENLRGRGMEVIVGDCLQGLWLLLHNLSLA